LSVWLACGRRSQARSTGQTSGALFFAPNERFDGKGAKFGLGLSRWPVLGREPARFGVHLSALATRGHGVVQSV
jgi:hypothetical protein